MSRGDHSVFVLAGQSNMAGRGSADEIPPKMLMSANNVLYDFVCSFGADGSSPHALGASLQSSDVPVHITREGAYATEGFRRLAPCPRHPSTPGAHFGPEIGFASRISEMTKGESFALIKHGRGGTNLHTDWHPEIDDHENLRRPYRHMAEQVAARMDELRSRGVSNPYVAGFFWFQGEGDTLNSAHASQYGSRLERFVSRIRALLGDAELPVILTDIACGADEHPVTRRPWMLHSRTVRDAIRRVTRADPRATLVETGDLETSDLVHLDSEGLLEVGRRMADAWGRLVG